MPLPHQLQALPLYDQGWPRLRQHKDEGIYETQRDRETHNPDRRSNGVVQNPRRGHIERPRDIPPAPHQNRTHGDEGYYGHLRVLHHR